jgi:excisionase family DNA binding protein
MTINATLNISQLSDLETRVTELEKKLLSKSKSSSPYATIKEAKEYLKCSYSKVRRLIDRGFLKKNLDSRHIQILWSSIHSYVGTTASS